MTYSTCSKLKLPSKCYSKQEDIMSECINSVFSQYMVSATYCEKLGYVPDI